MVGRPGGGQAGVQLTDVETVGCAALTGELEGCAERAGGVWRCK